MIEYDQIRTDYFEALGLKLLRFKNEEITQNFTEVCQVIQKETERRLKKER